MSDKVQNPQTKEEAQEEIISVCSQFHPDWLDERYVRDENGEYVSKKVYTGATRSKPANISHALVSAQREFGDDIVYPDDKLMWLSLDDYQSIAVAENTNNTAKKLISLCAQGKADEADKILPGFSKKYQSSINIISNGTMYAVEGDVFREMENDVRQNFSKIHPDFMEKTQARWKENRENNLIFEGDDFYKPISDSAYYLLVKAHYVYPSEENNKELAKIREVNDAVVTDMKQQKKERTKKTMKNDAQKAKQYSKSKQQSFNKEKKNETSPVATVDHQNSPAQPAKTNVASMMLRKTKSYS